MKGVDMPKGTCTIDGCDKPQRARAWCRDHYNRWYQTGDPRTPPARIPNDQCKADGCDRKPRSRTAELCDMHYCRLWRTGRLEFDPRPTECAAPECTEAPILNGLCRIHDGRYKRHGSFEAWAGEGITPVNWQGDSASYRAVHMRLAAKRGPAKEYACVDCGRGAEHWSYDHACPREKTSDYGPYSTDPDRYQPRCVACHKAFDLAHMHRPAWHPKVTS